MPEQNPSPTPIPPSHRRAIPVLYQGHAHLTWALLGMLLLIFGLEELLGGSEIGPVLNRLGANLPSETLHGAYWRLISSIFLHIGWIHLLANGLVLLLLGRFFEKLVGSRRFFLLFILSGVAGSWASATFSDADLSAGASGALWGLLGACLALSIFPGPVFPTPWVRSFRKNTLFNLGINFYFSTLANIDFAAHLGGGLLGLFLFASGFLTRGLPVQPQYAVPRLTQLALPRIFILCVLVTSISLLLPWIQQKPQALWGAPQLKTQILDLHTPKNAVPFQLAAQIPQFLELKKKDSPMANSLRFVLGDIKSDPVMIIISWIPLADTLNSREEQEAASIQVRTERQKQSLPAHTKIQKDFTWLQDAPFPSWQRTLKWDNGIVQHNFSQMQNNAMIDVQILTYEVFEPTYALMGPDLLRSLQLQDSLQKQ